MSYIGLHVQLLFMRVTEEKNEDCGRKVGLSEGFGQFMRSQKLYLSGGGYSLAFIYCILLQSTEDYMSSKITQGFSVLLR